MKKIHLSKDQINDRISELENELKNIVDDPSFKKKKLRIYSKLGKLKKSLQDPNLRVDPDELKKTITKRQEKKRAKIVGKVTTCFAVQTGSQHLVCLLTNLSKIN